MLCCAAIVISLVFLGEMTAVLEEVEVVLCCAAIVISLVFPGEMTAVLEEVEVVLCCVAIVISLVFLGEMTAVLEEGGGCAMLCCHCYFPGFPGRDDSSS